MSGLLEDLLNCEAEMNASEALPAFTRERYNARTIFENCCTRLVSDHLPELKRLLADEPIPYRITEAGRKALEGRK